MRGNSGKKKSTQISELGTSHHFTITPYQKSFFVSTWKFELGLIIQTKHVALTCRPSIAEPASVGTGPHSLRYLPLTCVHFHQTHRLWSCEYVQIYRRECHVSLSALEAAPAPHAFAGPREVRIASGRWNGPKVFVLCWYCMRRSLKYIYMKNLVSHGLSVICYRFIFW